jgi:hypothetical protein
MVSYLFVVITEMGSSINENFILFALVFSFLRSLFLTIVNVKHFARHTVGVFMEIFTRALTHVRIEISRFRVPALTFNIGDIRPYINQVNAAVFQDIEVIRERYSINRFSFWIALASAGVFVVGIGLRNPEVVSQIVNLIPSTVSGFFSLATIRRFLEVFSKNRMEGSVRAIQTVLNHIQFDPVMVIQPYLNYLDPLLVDERILQVLNNLIELF